ncbi:MAG TPA: hypothetical protein VG604_04810 [Candidatus Saccharimonadales bacterium]|nr:hypothetical protein [Candidatus Saccharimonadales bacterium]
MRANAKFPTVFDLKGGQWTLTPEWNVLLNNAREVIDRPGEALGYFVASVLSQEYRFGFKSLSTVEQACIDAAEPPMSPAEETDFRHGFGRVAALETVLVTDTQKIPQGATV